MFLGTVDDWTAEGTVVSWYPTEASHTCAARAERHPAPVSYQQSQHLQYYRRQTSLGRDIPRLCIGVWEIAGVCDIDAMTQAINARACWRRVARSGPCRRASRSRRIGSACRPARWLVR
jgi:hypothetical protein